MIKELLKSISIRTTGVALVVLAGYVCFPHGAVKAADFNTHVDLVYSVKDEGVMHIKETRTITNNSAGFYIKADSSETFIISCFKRQAGGSQEELQNISETISLKRGEGYQLSPIVEIKDNQIEVKAMYGRSISSGDRLQFILEYDNPALVEKNGQVWNIYIPGMAEGFNKVTNSDTNSTIQTTFSVSLNFDPSFGEPNFVVPESFTSETVSGRTNYIFEPSSLIGQSVWVQFGKKQIYSFRITQAVNSSYSVGSYVFDVFYDLLLPREGDKGEQQVYFKSISPDPLYVYKDDEKNITARFRFSSQQDAQIIIDGYIVTNITDKVEVEQVGNIGDIDLGQRYGELGGEEVLFRDLLEPSQYWETDAEQIQQVAAELQGDEENVLRVVLADYNFIIKNVDYDDLKAGDLNQRQGALKTLQGGSSVCMEYSDLLITLLRAQKIPARAAFGYGFDPKSGEEDSEGHQWVEVYMPNIGWVPVDPTWGDTGRRSYVGSDIDHALWRVAGLNVESPSPITKFSILGDLDLDAPKFDVQVVENIDVESFVSLEKLLNQYEYHAQNTFVERFSQLNNVGRVIFIGIPAILILLVIVSIITSVFKLIRRLLSR